MNRNQILLRFSKVIWICIVFISTNTANIQCISILMLFHFPKIEMRNTLFVGCEFVTRIFTFASVHVKDFTFFLVLVRTVSKEIIIFHFRLECNHISKRTKKYIKFSNNKKPNIHWVKLQPHWVERCQLLLPVFSCDKIEVFIASALGVMLHLKVKNVIFS